MARRSRRSTNRSRNRARARARAKASAKKRVSARKAAGKKPSGAKSRAQAKADARAKSQAAAKKRIAQGRTISQTKAANTASMRKAAAERNRKFQAEKAAKAAAKKQTPSASKTFNDAKNTIQNKNLIAASPGYTTEDMKNVINYQKKLQADPSYKMKGYEKDSIMRQYGRFPTAALDNVTNLGIGQEKTFFKVNPASSYGYPSQSEVDNAALGGGAGFIGRKPTGNPNVMSADGTFNRPGPGGPEPEADYTSYQPGSYYNQSDTNMNMTNALRSGRNLITSPFRALGINNRLTNKLIPKSNEAIQDARDQRGPRPTLKRRGGSGGASRIQQQAAAQAIQPEIAPTIGTPEEELLPSQTAPQGDLTRIQNQAYNTQLTSSLSNMFGGQGSVGYTPQGSPELSPTLRAGRSRGRRRVRMFGGRARRGGTGDQFSRAGDRILKLTNLNIK